MGVKWRQEVGGGGGHHRADRDTERGTWHASARCCSPQQSWRATSEPVLWCSVGVDATLTPESPSCAPRGAYCHPQIKGYCSLGSAMWSAVYHRGGGCDMAWQSISDRKPPAVVRCNSFHDL